MGYTLMIGGLETSIEKDGLRTYIRNDVKGQSLENAPAFNEPTDNTNARWPSYSVWHRAMEFVGLDDLMYNEEHGLIRDHPGCVPLVPEHKEIIDKAHKEFYEKYPNCVAGFAPGSTILESSDPNWPEENMYAVRLEWLKFWVDWALENCKQPMFYNS